MVKAKIISSLEKCFYETKINSLKEIKHISALKNERLNIQLAYTESDCLAPQRIWVNAVVTGELAKFSTIRTVEMVPVNLPTNNCCNDTNYIGTEPGLYPDILQDLCKSGRISVVAGQVHSLWIEFDFSCGVPSGEYSIKISLLSASSNETITENTVNIKIINAQLPKQDIYLTQWFHCDCLSDYYNVPVFSVRHWEIIENFLRTAVRNGINTILTPVFTPPLDTEPLCERKTVQLVDVTVDNGVYSFGFEKLEKWIKICDKCGVEHFEISHFFTQWGAAHAPKIMALKNGEYTRIFGWETDATGEEYKVFLREFLRAFLAFMKTNNNDKRCIFHISDEPNISHLEQYKAARSIVEDLLSDYMIVDALSNFAFYQSGAVKYPVCSNNHIEPFIENAVPDLWTYYCCSQHTDVSNRFIAMPSARNRIIGAQMYKYNIKGFLQWGYNFYYNQYSRDLINPYTNTCGDYFVPSGDTFSVYPGYDGKAVESLRIAVFYEALQDMRAMRLCEGLCGKDAVISALESVCGEIKFNRSNMTGPQIIEMREKINSLIENA